MDYEWIKACGLVILAVMAIAVSASYTIRVLLNSDREKERFWNARKRTYKKCDMVDSSQWVRAMDAASAHNAKGIPPVVAFPFADSVNGEKIECDFLYAIDYGIAVGYKKPESKGVDLMVSYVFATEDITDGKGSMTIEQRQEMISKLGRAVQFMLTKAPRFGEARPGSIIISDDIERMIYPGKKRSK